VPASPVGRSTAGCIQSGVVHLFLDGVGGLLDRTLAAVDAPGQAPPFVVATGGWGGWLAAQLPGRVHAVDPHLVLEGVRLLASGIVDRG
jgi:pantothenate kinase type III